MLRRKFLLQLLNPNDAPPTPENLFARAYNSWAEIRTKDILSGSGRLISVNQIRAWSEVKKAWKQLTQYLDY